MKKSATIPEDLKGVAREAKALVALAFRNGPIENVHAGKACPSCQGDPQYSHLTQAEMRQIMKAAVDRLYSFLVLRQHDQKAYDALISLGERYTTAWDDPVLEVAPVFKTRVTAQQEGHEP
jgi:aspartokinase